MTPATVMALWTVCALRGAFEPNFGNRACPDAFRFQFHLETKTMRRAHFDDPVQFLAAAVWIAAMGFASGFLGYVALSPA